MPVEVESGLPFHMTTDCPLKPEPSTAMIVCGDPATREVGEICVTMGVGGGASMAKGVAPEVPPPGAELTAVMERLPLEVTSAEVSEKLTLVALV